MTLTDKLRIVSTVVMVVVIFSLVFVVCKLRRVNRQLHRAIAALAEVRRMQAIIDSEQKVLLAKLRVIDIVTKAHEASD